MMDERADWVARVLGVDVGAEGEAGAGHGAGSDAGGSFDAAAWAKARAGWDDAVSDVDRQIGDLQVALRTSDDPELQGIAQFGLNALTGGRRVALTAALLELRDGAGAGACAKSIGAFRAFLASDEVVEACDRNPLGVAVAIRATLDPALAGMERALGG
jgi:hypothetical protein